AGLHMRTSARRCGRSACARKSRALKAAGPKGGDFARCCAGCSRSWHEHRFTQTGQVDTGADVNATAEMYGGGSTAVGLLVTSDHPAKAGVTGDVLKVLVDAGAKS